MKLNIEVITEETVKNHLTVLGEFIQSIATYLDLIGKDKLTVEETIQLLESYPKLNQLAAELNLSIEALIAKHSKIEAVGTKEA